MAEDEAPASSETPGWMDLSAKERETLRVIKENLIATQQELGETLGVTAATVSNRLRDIDGFEEQDRQAFVSQIPHQQILGDGQGQTHAELPAEITPDWRNSNSKWSHWTRTSRLGISRRNARIRCYTLTFTPTNSRKRRNWWL